MTRFVSARKAMLGATVLPAYMYASGATFPQYAVATGKAEVYVPSTNKIWKAWEAWDSVNSARVIKVAVFDCVTRQWGRDVIVGALLNTNDDHGAPTLVRDHEGYFHVFFDGHGSTNSNQHYATVSPDLNVWVVKTSLGSDNTYPHVIAANSRLFAFVRGQVEKSLSVFTSSALSGGTVTWNSRKTLVTWGATDVFYQGAVFLSNDASEIYILASRGLNGDVDGRQSVYCFIYKVSDGSIRNLANSVSVASGSQPIDATTSDTSFRLVDQSGGTYGSMPDGCLTSNGNLHFVYLEGASGNGSSYTLKYRNWNGSVLSSAEDVGTVHERYALPALACLSDDSLELYTGQDPNALWYRGGDIVRRRRSAAGVWGSDETIAVAQTKPLSMPSVILGGPTNARVTFCEIANSSLDPPSSDGGSLKGYLYGASGLTRRRTPSPLAVPYSLFADRYPGLFYDFSDAATLFQDTAGATPTGAAGNPIGLLKNKAWTGAWDGSQGTAGSKPTLRNPSGSIWYGDFDGGDHFVTTLLPQASFTIVAAFRVSSTATIIAGSNDASNYCFMNVDGSGRLGGGNGSQTAGTIHGTSVITNTDVVGLLRVSPSNVNLRVNGVSEYSAAPAGGVSTRAIYFGGRNNDGSIGDRITGRVYALLVFMGIRLSDADCALAEAFLATKF